MSLNIIFAGTPEFSAVILQALLQSKHNVQCVYTQPDKPTGRGQRLGISATKALALQHQLPIQQPTTLKNAEAYATLAHLNPDIIIVAAYGFLIPQPILDLPKYGCLNVHASLLPRWRGASPIQQAILHQDKISGISIMQMEAGLDTGDVLKTADCPIYKKDTSQELHDRLAPLGATTLLETLDLLEEGKLSPLKQDDTLATYAPKITKANARIDWTETTATIQAKIQAYSPWPIAFTHFNEKTIRIYQSTPIDSTNTLEPGTILSADKSGIQVTTGDGVISLLILQMPGGKKLGVADLLNAKSAIFASGNRLN